MGRVPIEKTRVYEMAREVSNRIYQEVAGWPAFPKQALGLQLVRSADSIGANLVEGDGRSYDLDSARFFDYAGGSCREAKHWITIAGDRNFIGEELRDEWLAAMDEIGKMVAGLMAYRRKNAPLRTREERLGYDLSDE